MKTVVKELFQNVAITLLVVAFCWFLLAFVRHENEMFAAIAVATLIGAVMFYTIALIELWELWINELIDLLID